MDLSLEHWSLIIDSLLSIAALLLPGVAIYAGVLKKTKDQLVSVLNQAPMDNQSIFDLAQQAGKKQAAKAIGNLLNS